MKKHLALLLALCMVLSLALGACGSKTEPAAQPSTPSTPSTTPSTPAQPATTPTEPAKTGSDEKVLTIGTYMAIVTLVPWKTTSDGDGYVIRQVYQTLLDMDENSNFLGNLAESWEASEDGLQWTFHIRKDCYWQRGNELFGDELVPVTAHDVKYSYEKYMDPDFGSVRYSDLVGTIDHIECPDDYTVVFYTKDIDVLFEYRMYQSYIICEKMIEANWDFENHPLGSGAYKFVEHKTDTHVILERNEDFFVRPALDRIVYKIITDKSVSAIALQNKEVDISLAILATEVANIAKYDYLRLASGGTGSYRWVGFRCDWSFFQDKELRKALRRAIDWDGAIAALFANDAGVELARRAYSCIPYERPGGDIDDSAKAMWESYDPAAAQARLDELGWVKGSDGIRAKDGQKLSFTLQVGNNDSARERLAVIIASSFQAIGVDCTAQTAEWGTHTTDIKEGNVEMYILGGYSSLDGGLRMMKTNTTTHSPNCGYSNPVIDEKLNQAWKTTDYDARSAILRECAAIFAGDAAHLGGYFEYTQMGINTRVTDFDHASVYRPLCTATRNVGVE
ncbi:MAG: ABC transporter substrate-binding protein [Firmicutes bacterium]|nr:ABC transporter substrate-binding protein [Bacillota bacterium]MBQ2456081.1 ABC transporter substrate-binding protein [Bacillota bacterium]